MSKTFYESLAVFSIALKTIASAFYAFPVRWGNKLNSWPKTTTKKSSLNLSVKRCAIREILESAATILPARLGKNRRRKEISIHLQVITALPSSQKNET